MSEDVRNKWDYAIVTVSRAFFDSPLWFTWCGDEQHIINNEGKLARYEAARIALDSLAGAGYDIVAPYED